MTSAFVIFPLFVACPCFVTFSTFRHFSCLLPLPLFVTFPSLCRFSHILSLIPHFVTFLAFCHSLRVFNFSRALSPLSCFLSQFSRFVTFSALVTLPALFPRFVTLPAFCQFSRAFHWLHSFQHFLPITGLSYAVSWSIWSFRLVSYVKT